MQHTESFRQRMVRLIGMCGCYAIVVPCVVMGFRNVDPLAEQQSGASQPIPTTYSIECEDLVGSAELGKFIGPLVQPGKVVSQQMGSFGQGWSGNAQLIWYGQVPAKFPKQVSPTLFLSFNAPAPGTYEIVLHYTTAPDYGTFDVFLDGEKKAGNIVGYSAKVAPKAKSLGNYLKLAGGSHKLLLQVSGKHEPSFGEHSKGYAVGLDRIELKPIAVPPQNRRAP